MRGEESVETFQTPRVTRAKRARMCTTHVHMSNAFRCLLGLDSMGRDQEDEVSTELSDKD